MDQIELSAAIIAIIAAIKTYIPQIQDGLTVLLAAVIGGVAGYFQFQGVPDILTGVILGLTAVGAHTLARTVRGREPQEEKATEEVDETHNTGHSPPTSVASGL